MCRFDPSTSRQVCYGPGAFEPSFDLELGWVVLMLLLLLLLLRELLEGLVSSHQHVLYKYDYRSASRASRRDRRMRHQYRV